MAKHCFKGVRDSAEISVQTSPSGAVAVHVAVGLFQGDAGGDFQGNSWA